MITKIKITLTSGQKYTLKSPDRLQDVDSKRECLFVFDNAQIFLGLTDGKVDDDGDFRVTRPNARNDIGLPFERLVGWAYKREKKS